MPPLWADVYLYVFALTTLGAICVQGATLIRNDDVVTLVNGVVTAAKQLVIQCDETDAAAPFQFTIYPPDNSTSVNVTVVCPPPSIIYTPTPLGTVPTRGDFVPRKWCNLADPSRYIPPVVDQSLLNLGNYSGDGTSLQEMREARHAFQLQGKQRLNAAPEDSYKPDNKLQPPTRRYDGVPRKPVRWYYLEEDPDAVRPKRDPLFIGPDSLQDWLAEPLNSNAFYMELQRSPAGRKLLDASTAVAIGLGALGPVGSVFGMILCLFSSCGGGGDSCSTCQSQIDSLKTLYDKQNAALQEYATQSKLADDKLNTALTGVVGTTQQALNWANTSQQVAAAALAQSNANLETTKQIQQGIATQVNSVSDRLTATQTALAQVQSQAAAFNAATQGTIEYVVSLLSNSTTQINQSLAALSQALQDRSTSLETKIWQLNTQLQNTVQLMRQMFQQTDTAAHLTGIFQADIANLSRAGVYTPFLTNLGTPPASNLGQFSKVYIDSVELVFVQDVSGTPTINNYNFTLYCDPVWVLSAPGGVTNWLDLFASIGPNSCNPDIPGNCKCWIIASHASCTTLVANVTAANMLNYVDRAFCNPGGSYTIDAITTYYNATVFTNALKGVVCPKTLYAGTNYRVASNRVKKRTTVTQDTAVCTQDLSSSLSGDASLNWMWLTFKYFVDSYSLMNNNIDYYRNLVDGVIPGDLTFVYHPFENVDGQPANCIEAAFTAYDRNSYQPVTRYGEPQQSTSVTVFYGNASKQQSSLTADIKQQFVLQAVYTMVGSPFASIIYDIPESDMSVSVNPETRIGMPTYPICSLTNATRCTLAQWEAENPGYSYDHYAGANVAGLYARHVDNVTGLCVGVAPRDEGTLCTMRANFFVSSQGDALVLEPRSYSQIVSVQIPITGAVVLQTFSACPAVSIVPVSSTTSNLILTNQAASTSTNAIIVTGPVGCAFSLLTVQVPAGGSFQRLIPCALGGNLIANVYYYPTGIGGSPAPCAGATNLSVSTNRTALVAAGVVDALVVNASVDVGVSPVGIAIANVAQRLQGQTMSIITSIVAGLALNGIQLPASTLQQMALSINQSAITTDLVNQLLIDARNTSNINVTAIGAAYDKRITDQTAAIDPLLQRAQKILDDAIASNKNDSENIALWKNTSDAANRALALYANISKQVTDLQLNLFQNFADSIKTNSNGLGNFFGALADGLASAGGWVLDEAKDGFGRFTDLVGQIAKTALGLLGGIVNIVLVIGIAIGAVVAGIVFYKFVLPRIEEATGAAGRARADMYEEQLKAGVFQGAQATAMQTLIARLRAGGKGAVEAPAYVAPPPPPPPPPAATPAAPAAAPPPAPATPAAPSAPAAAAPAGAATTGLGRHGPARAPAASTSNGVRRRGPPAPEPSVFNEQTGALQMSNIFVRPPGGPESSSDGDNDSLDGSHPILPYAPYTEYVD